MLIFPSKEPKMEVVDNIYNAVADIVSKYIHNKKGFKVLEIGCYTRYNIRGEIKEEFSILSKLAKMFTEVPFVGIDPKIPKNLIEIERKSHPNIILYPRYLEEIYHFLKENYTYFDLIYSVNVLHLVDDINLHLQCIHNLLRHNGLFIAGWNLVGVPTAENLPRHKNQEIVNIIHRYFKRKHSLVYVYHEHNHYHVFLLLILKK